MTYETALAAAGREADERIAALDLELHNAQTERDIAQREAADASAEVTRLESALGAEQVARRAADARVALLEQQLRNLLSQQEAALSVAPAGSRVAFLDTFSGASVDQAKWTIRNDSGQSNNYGANRPANAVVDAGLLSLWMRREAAGTDPYTVAYLDTNVKPGNVAVGLWEFRMAMSRARGSWPAGWLRPVGAPGEIDAVEWVGDGKGGGRFVFTVHENTNGVDAAGNKTRKRGFEWTPPVGFDPFVQHTYAVRWDGTTLAWLVDGTVMTKVTTAELSWLAGCLAGKPLALRLCMQAGGSMPKYYGLDADATTVLPDRAFVDYVRVLTPA
jgi:beta-glucanase (GH16 family)